jgi:hypothetical protein
VEAKTREFASIAVPPPPKSRARAKRKELSQIFLRFFKASTGLLRRLIHALSK